MLMTAVKKISGESPGSGWRLSGWSSGSCRLGGRLD